ncbi:Nitrilotriacetate monooxygenase component B [Leucobacter sp. 7(1)]|uniref:flavin reductase n=1 Tax=Leucobacter sp. 7(1) TaxID=1255613 RepID=UPI00097E8E4D|nr:flavin reductase [Leucobacter sp. 7(1)]SJN11210.1 Nitrilotriacetate monooxygenase component B [Leucobacter sp. 7(1)]
MTAGAPGGVAGAGLPVVLDGVSDKDAQPVAAPRPATLRQVMAQYPTGVTVITSRDPDGVPRGQVVGTFLRVSDEPELVGFFAMHASRTWLATKPTLTQFCVNIVSDHQEALCQSLASGSAPGLTGIPHSASHDGNPALHGAIAHIDCTVEQILPFGDHDFVVGRVTHAHHVSAAHPLVFFRGGFGRFASTSRTGNDHDFRAQLAEVDLLRPEMDALAAATGCAVTINALDGDETVVVAAATQAGPRALRVRVGQRLPFAAPFGSLEAAFGPDALRQRWLDADVTTGNTREQNAAVLDAVRARGYMISYGHDAHARIVSAAQQLAKRDPARRAEYLAELRNFDAVYNGKGSAGLPPEFAAGELRSIAVPVYGFDGGLAYGLTLWGPARPVSRAEQGTLVTAALRCAGACSGILGG